MGESGNLLTGCAQIGIFISTCLAFGPTVSEKEDPNEGKSEIVDQESKFDEIDWLLER